MRRRNLVTPGEFPYTSATGNVYDSGSYHAALARLLEAARYRELRREQETARAAGRYLGIGLSCFIELTGPGAQFYGVGGAPISGQEGTTVRLEPSGAVTALVGVTNQGQGTPTAPAQIIADELGVDVERVRVVSGDTAVVPYGGGTWASRGMPIGGSASMLAARALAEKIRRLSAVRLEAHADDIELRDGHALVRGSDRGLALSELARTVHFRSNDLGGLEPSLEATIHYTNPVAWTFSNGLISPLSRSTSRRAWCAWSSTSPWTTVGASSTPPWSTVRSWVGSPRAWGRSGSSARTTPAASC